MQSEELVDVVVVGGGFGGIYDAYRFREAGRSVIGLEAASGFGGVWFHNNYPGSRVDGDSLDYCYHFSPEIYAKWRWSERYAGAPELRRYLEFVVDELGVRTLFRLNTAVCAAQWSPEDHRWHVVATDGSRIACRFLVMCTGNLSEPKPPQFPGLASFEGEWVQTNRWPQREVQLAGRRVGIIGTGSSGVQAVPVVARQAEQLYVFQRTPHYAVPARNGRHDDATQAQIAEDVIAHQQRYLTQGVLPRGSAPPRPMSDCTADEVRAALERQWEYGGHGMSYLFSDQRTDRAVNEVIAKFVRAKIREVVRDPAVAEKLIPTYPIGTRRLALEIGYYEAFNRDNVTLVDMRAAPIDAIVPEGVRTADGSVYEVDLLIFAIGFQAFLGALDAAGIRNENGMRLGDVWARGPRTLFGQMTPGFPNLFTPTGAGSPSTLSHLVLQHEFLADWMIDCMAHMDEHGFVSIEASDQGADQWGAVVAEVSANLLRRQENQYMVHVNEDDGSRVFIPFAGGLHVWAEHMRRSAADGYSGFVFE